MKNQNTAEAIGMAGVLNSSKYQRLSSLIQEMETSGQESAVMRIDKTEIDPNFGKLNEIYIRRGDVDSNDQGNIWYQDDWLSIAGENYLSVYRKGNNVTLIQREYVGGKNLPVERRPVSYRNMEIEMSIAEIKKRAHAEDSQDIAELIQETIQDLV